MSHAPQHPPACPRCGESNTVRAGDLWVCRHTSTERVRGRITGVAPNMNPLAPGPMPGEPVFEWHTQTVSCGNRFTDAEAEEAARRRRQEKERQALWAQRHREAEQRAANLERERDEALRRLPVLNRPQPEHGPVGRGCAIGCVLWVVLLAVSLAVLAMNGQLDSEDPRILGADNPLVFLPAMWLVGWVIALLQWPVIRWRRRRAEAAADRRESERARLQADFEGRIAAARRAARP